MTGGWWATLAAPETDRLGSRSCTPLTTHAKKLGSATTVCGLPTPTWRRRWVPFEAEVADACVTCAAAVVHSRQDDEV